MRRFTSLAQEQQATISAYVLCAVLFVIGTVHSSGFASQSNIRQMLVFASFIGFAALGQTLVILAGGLDLSVPWIMAFGGIQLSHWAVNGIPAVPAILLVLLVGVAIGVINGVGIAYLRIPPIVMTLAVGGLVQAYLLSIGLLKSQGNQVPAAAVDLASNRLGPVPIVALVWIAAAAAASIVLKRTVVGRRIYAVGANEVVADLSGVDVARTRLVTYAISGGVSAFAGVVLAGYVGTTYLDIGGPYLFTAIAAVIVGGVSILGGSGTYWGTVAGALTLTVLSAMLPLFHLSDAGLKIVYGIVILAGVWMTTHGAPMLAALRTRKTPLPPSSQEGSTAHAH
jgi:ribose transport system permease protein